MPADTTETVAKHSAKLQSSCALFWYPIWDEGSGMYCADRSIIAYCILAPSRDSKLGHQIHERWLLPCHALHTKFIEYTQQDSNFDGLFVMPSSEH